MPTRDLEMWMWNEALRALDRADRLQRQAARAAAQEAPVQWEPAVDVYETGSEIWIQAALPGVSEASLSIEQHGGVLVISGTRKLPEVAQSGAVHRLEIPRGRFERRLRLPRRALRLDRREILDGCLILQLTKI